ncbi:hypothetical protein BS78_05G005100 [Paspalum vaginatum]|nr:hypothetical protein BS78_05G005100 [Paspalum vaginatum]
MIISSIWNKSIVTGDQVLLARLLLGLVQEATPA